MKVVTILGSPKKKGNTGTVLSWIEDELRARGHDVDHVDIVDYDINGCMGCYACQANPDEPACVQKDDAGKIFDRMISADAIIFSSPLYAWEFSAQIKPLIDRSLCLVSGYGSENHKSLIGERPIGLLMTCAGPLEGNADLIQEAFDRQCKWVRAERSPKLIVPLTSTPDKLGDEVKEKARAFANEIVAQS